MLIVAALGCGALACISIFEGKRLEAGLGILSALMAGLLGACFMFMGWRIYKKEQIPSWGMVRDNDISRESYTEAGLAQFPTAAPEPELRDVSRQLSAKKFSATLATANELLQRFPDDLRLMVASASACEGMSDYKKAEEIWSRLVVLATKSEMKAAFLSWKMSALIRQAEFAAFLAALKVFCAQPVSNHIKVSHLDNVACIPLYERLPSVVYGTVLQLAEFSVRKALELAPGLVSLKGTLGGCLVELGRPEEAEPLLQECYKKGSMLDHAICALFLGLIAEQRKDRRAMEHFAREAALLSGSGCLVERAKLFRGRVEQMGMER